MVNKKSFCITHPYLLTEWDYEKNKGIDPNNVSPGSDKKYWWLCPKGHSYFKSPASRTNLKTGCPYCANKKVLKGYNDLATTRPDLLKIWNYERNNKLGIYPTEVTSVSGKKVWWKCELGHEWEARIADPSYGRGCPECHKGNSTSFPEQAIYYYLSKIDKSCINRYKVENKYEIDIFIKNKNIGIEYDGYRWHQDEEKILNDYNKDINFAEQGILVYRIKEQNSRISEIEKGDYILFDDYTIYLNDDDIEALNEVIKELIEKIYNKKIIIDIEKDRANIYKSYLNIKKENSVASNKKIIKYWDYEKNLNINPNSITKSSGKIVWWKCEKGHSFKASVHSVDKGKYCPICKEEQYKKLGFNFNNKRYIGHLRNVNGTKSFVDIKPELLTEWDYEKNKDIDPRNMFPGTSQYVWWKCQKCGYEWEAPISNRVKGHGCKKCAYIKAAQKKYNPVEQYTKEGIFIKEYNSIKEATAKTGVSHVSCVCRGERKTAGGYIWRYKNN